MIRFDLYREYVLPCVVVFGGLGVVYFCILVAAGVVNFDTSAEVVERTPAVEVIK